MSTINEKLLRQKLSTLQLAATNLNSSQQDLRQNAQLMHEKIQDATKNQINSIMSHGNKLINELNGKIDAKEEQILKKQQDLYMAIGICQQALQTVHITNSQKQLNETLAKLNSLNLQPFQMKQIRFEANSNGFSNFGQIVDDSNVRNFDRRCHSFNDDLSEMDDDFEIVNETDSTTIESSFFESTGSSTIQKPIKQTPTFRENISQIINSSTHKWLLKPNSSGSIQKKIPINKSHISKPSTHKINMEKPKMSFEEVIRSIQQSPNHKWLSNFNANCSNSNDFRLINNSQRIAPLIMHHV